MSAQGWLEDIPVVMISSEDSSQTVRRAYELGASDYISRPFDARIVHRRVSNVARLYARQRRLSALVSQQFYDREKNDQMMIGILGQVMEIHKQREHPPHLPGAAHHQHPAGASVPEDRHLRPERNGPLPHHDGLFPP